MALTPAEQEAYRRYVEANKPALAPSTASGFFSLYLQGHSCEEIARLNPSFGLGIIVKACIDNDWDGQRLQHTQHLLANIRQVVEKTQLESIQFVAEGLAVYQKLAGQHFQKYLQTGKEEDLGDFRNMSFKTYKELLELLLKLTGQEAAKKVSGVVEHHHTVGTPQVTIDVPRQEKPITAEAAADFLKHFDKKAK